MTITWCGSVGPKSTSLGSAFNRITFGTAFNLDPQFPRLYMVDDVKNGDDDGTYDYVNSGDDDD